VQAAEDERRAKGLVADRAADKTAGKPADPPIVMAADKLKKGLEGLEKRLWLSPETKGLIDDQTVLGKIGYIEGALGSAMTPPTPGHREYLRQAGAALDAFLADFNRFYAVDVPAFRQQAAAEKIELLPDLPPLQARGAARP
jgi:hypothetical protein